MTTKAVDMDTHILAKVSQIAGQYGVHIGTNLDSEIQAENFENVGKLVHFKLEVEYFLNTLNLMSFTIGTRYNPYEVVIRWRE